MHRDEQHLLDMGLSLLSFIGTLTVCTYLLGLVVLRDFSQMVPCLVVASNVLDLVDLHDRVESFDETKQLVTVQDGLVANQGRSAVLYIILDSFVNSVAALVE
jgi:hypothetical protein